MSAVAYGVRRRCPQCSGELLGVPSDRHVLCFTCRRAHAVKSESSLPVRFAGARGYDGGAAIPFFRFAEIRPGARALTDAAAAAVERVNSLAAVWTVAVRIRHFQGYGDVGFEYTRRPPRLDADLEPSPTLGVARSLEDAERVARVLLWRALSEAAPVGSFALEPNLGRAEIWCVATSLDAGLVKFPHCPIRYPASQIEGYVES